VYDGGDCVQERDDAGLLTKQFVRGTSLGGGIGGVLYNEDASAVREYFVYNAIGSTVATVSGFWPLVVESTNDYDAFGNVVESTGSTDNNRLFCTKERSAGIGLDNFGMRYYDPVLGRFLTRDPAGYPDGPNNYLYCNNNPINFIDPLGLAENILGGTPYDELQRHKIDNEGLSESRPSREPDVRLSPFAEKYVVPAAEKVGDALDAVPKTVSWATDTFRPHPEDAILGAKAFKDAYATGNIPGMLSAAGVTLMGIADIVDVIPDPTDILQKQARKAAQETTETAADAIRKGAGEAGGESGNTTSRAARRKAMRDSGTPTSRSANSQSGSKGRRQYVTEGADGNPRVQTQHPPDSNHSNAHWHDANPKRDPVTGEIRKNNHGQIKYESGGTAAEFNQ
jgi:RHS repeat-associated protein